ncbi:MAG: hypothetical protein KME15_20610 [Drouetiella hepatica Uher 2000/2452]|jgi:hypothetical protein|uniref:Uncharacterized protein n=1 Tax=Drouetiella hepatica Uher 2000/2452 TaxID=904376 RepID=A0A951UPR0_9CYAN|nr:hypothetical protein [Drouetiella hepatica Uher 2000/2452]
MFLSEIRQKPESTPMERLICALKWMPRDCFRHLELSYPSLNINEAMQSEHLKEWFEEAEARHGTMGDWIAKWAFGMDAPQGDFAALCSYGATSLFAFMDLCRALHKLSPYGLRDFPSSNGWMELTLRAESSRFLCYVADCGVAKELGIPGYPGAWAVGKTDLRKERVAALRSIGVEAGNRSKPEPKPKPGRPKKTVVKVEDRRYPSNCLLYENVVKEADRIAKINTEFRRGVYQRWLDAVSAETAGMIGKDFQVGIVSEGKLIVGGKGFKISGKKKR